MEAFGQLEYLTPSEQLHDTTVRRHWEQARKVNIDGDIVTLDPTARSPKPHGLSNDYPAPPKHFRMATVDFQVADAS